MFYSVVFEFGVKGSCRGSASRLLISLGKVKDDKILLRQIIKAELRLDGRGNLLFHLEHFSPHSRSSIVRQR